MPRLDIMIADGGGVVPHEIHHGRAQMLPIRPLKIRKIDGRLPLQNIAVIEQNHLLMRVGALLLDIREHLRQRRRRGVRFDKIIREQRAVRVRCFDNFERDRLGMA